MLATSNCSEVCVHLQHALSPSKYIGFLPLNGQWGGDIFKGRNVDYPGELDGYLFFAFEDYIIS